MKKIKKQWRSLDEPVVVGYWHGKGGIDPQSPNDDEYMHGYNNGAVDAARERGELNHVIFKPL